MITTPHSSKAVNAARLAHFRSRIEQKSRDRSAAPVLIMAMGDSVTQGVGRPDELYHDDVYHALLKRALENRYPTCTFSMINVGVDGDTTGGALARLDRDVLRHQPDLLLVAFGLNDSTKGREGLVEFSQNLRNLCARVRAESSTDIVLITPNMMLMRPSLAIPEQYTHLTSQFLEIQNSGLLSRYAECAKMLGQELQFPVVDVYAAWNAMSVAGVDTTAMLVNGLNHPDKFGHQIAANFLAAVIVQAVAV
jgi:lysophospholipase L1-like esterase